MRKGNKPCTCVASCQAHPERDIIECRQSIGRYDDYCGLRKGHDGACLNEFTVNSCGLEHGRQSYAS